MNRSTRNISLRLLRNAFPIATSSYRIITNPQLRSTPSSILLQFKSFYTTSGVFSSSSSSSSSHKSTSPTQTPPAQNHATAISPRPAKDGSNYWETMSSAIPNASDQQQQKLSNHSTTYSPLSGMIENVEVNTAPGVVLDGHEKQLVGSVLDLFQGKPSRQKLELWRDDAVFEDNINKAIGRREFEAQWYGLQKIMSEIKTLSHTVTRTDPNIEIQLEQLYKIKAIGKEQVIKSTVSIDIDGEGKIRKVQDQWGGKLPEGKISEFFRRMNASMVSMFVGVPTNGRQDVERKG